MQPNEWPFVCNILIFTGFFPFNLLRSMTEIERFFEQLNEFQYGVERTREWKRIRMLCTGRVMFVWICERTFLLDIYLITFEAYSATSASLFTNKHEPRYEKWWINRLRLIGNSILNILNAKKEKQETKISSEKGKRLNQMQFTRRQHCCNKRRRKWFQLDEHSPRVNKNINEFCSFAIRSSIISILFFTSDWLVIHTAHKYAQR